MITGTLYPGDGTYALRNSATDLQARVYRQGFGGNLAKSSVGGGIFTSVPVYPE